MAPVPNLKHQRVQFRLGRRLGQFIEERHGVAQYWLVDPAEGTVSLHCRRGGALTAALTFGRGETLHSPLLAGLKSTSTTSSRESERRSAARPSR